MSNSLKDRKVLVTGGAGFIGSHIVDKLVKLGAEVTVVDNLITGNLDNLEQSFSKIKFIKSDFADQKILDQVLPGVELISHQAALRSVPKSVEAPLDYHKVNVSGTLNLFLAAKEAGIKRIVCASSSSIYGERDDFPEKENEIAKPISPYAATKLIVEQYSYVFSKIYNMKILNLRYFNVYGPRQSLEDEYAVVIPKFINCLFEGKSPPIYGDGNQERDFTFISDVVDMNIRCLEKDNVGSEAFNVGLGIPNSVNNLFNNLKEIIGSKLEPNYCPIRLGDVRKTHADIQKAKELLGFSPKVDFAQGLKKTVDWFREAYK
ncbi:MAG: SDR family oxidoreductase [Candidatus Omnitrophica bacterium]|nr:SDR family oxidoreductase [Candidatus Omnitrophota bacterium]